MIVKFKNWEEVFILYKNRITKITIEITEIILKWVDNIMFVRYSWVGKYINIQDIQEALVFRTKEDLLDNLSKND